MSWFPNRWMKGESAGSSIFAVRSTSNPWFPVDLPIFPFTTGHSPNFAPFEPAKVDGLGPWTPWTPWTPGTRIQWDMLQGRQLFLWGQPRYRAMEWVWRYQAISLLGWGKGQYLLYIYIYTYIYIHWNYACMYVFMYVCMYACMYVCMYGCMYVCIYAYMYICIYVCMYMYICIYVYMYICIYVYMYICIYVYVYIYICKYVYM